MKGTLPSPAMRLFGRETCVVMPSFVQEFVRTIRQIAPCQRRNRINDPQKFGFRPPELVEGTSESFLRSLAFNCDQCDVPRALDQREIRIRGYARLGTVQSECAKHLIILRQDRLGPRRSYPIPDRKVAISIRPARIRSNVGYDDSRFQERGSATQTCFQGDWHRAYN